MNDDLARRLHAQAKADRWSLSLGAFADALQASADAKGISSRDFERYAASLHVEDLALACACAAGDEAAWEHFIREQRPVLYRAADALDPTGGARDIADALYADLYGLRGEGERRSLFRYFHGRSSLSTWLRAVLAQRHVDRARTARRFEPLPEEEATPPTAGPSPDSDRDRTRYLSYMQEALAGALDRLAARDRLRLGCYYVQDLTLAETGRILREHEATVSRQLARTRREIRKVVEAHLRSEAGFSDEEITGCFESTASDAGAIDLRRMLREETERKTSAPERSMDRESL